MTDDEIIRYASDISGELYTLANQDAFRDGIASPMMKVLREFFRNTAFTIDTIVEELTIAADDKELDGKDRKKHVRKTHV